MDDSKLERRCIYSFSQSLFCCQKVKVLISTLMIIVSKTALTKLHFPHFRLVKF